ncbi:putative GPI-anchored protein 46 [Spathaspora sp. JA1]|nr:putative GPI-anchored protein 46 [Spathaspora sp. JA1]
MKLPIPFLILFQLVFLLLVSDTIGFDLTINEQSISDPINYVKSTFRQYIPTPQLQEKLEIPIVHPMQKTIRESFIQERPPKPKKFGIRSYFRGERDKVMGMSVDENQEQTINVVDSEGEEEDEEEVPHKMKNNIDPIHSLKSWVKEFLIFKQNKKISIASVGGNKNSLRTKIKNYDDTESDPEDLKRWVQLIKSEDNDDDDSISNGITKKYSNHNDPSNNEIEIDIDEFIKYLVNEQGFNPVDLQFLRTRNLDYGLGEIERELNKVKDQKRSPKVIKIGGEEESSGLHKQPYSYIMIFLLVIMFG